MCIGFSAAVFAGPELVDADMFSVVESAVSLAAFVAQVSEPVVELEPDVLCEGIPSETCGFQATGQQTFAREARCAPFVLQLRR